MTFTFDLDIILFGQGGRPIPSYLYITLLLISHRQTVLEKKPEICLKPVIIVERCKVKKSCPLTSAN